MKLVTWNCCRGRPEVKLPLLAPFCADIAVLQECARPEQESDSCLWFGDNPRMGILVVAKPPYSLRALPVLRSIPKFVIPVAVSGPVPFTLFVVWAKAGQKYRYVRGVIQALHRYREHFRDADVVVAGDLNSNAIWDDEHPPGRSHSALVEILSGQGLVSGYHEFFGEAHGAESRPTCFLLWKEERPYHLDYCFFPRRWMPVLERVAVGTFEAWKAMSDHRPLLVEFRGLPGRRAATPLGDGRNQNEGGRS
jgi:hypothetical protein